MEAITLARPGPEGQRAPAVESGEKVAPRYSIVPGDFVDDDRPKLAHVRVLLALGRRTNRAGWCVINQGKLAAHMGLARGTVNAAIADLVTWGYVEKRSQQQTKRALCHYRVLLDRAVPEADPDDGIGGEDDGEDDAPGGEAAVDAPGQSYAERALLAYGRGDVSPTDDTHVSSTDDTHVSPTDDRRVTSQVTRGVTSQVTRLTTPSRTTPLSQRGHTPASGALVVVPEGGGDGDEFLLAPGDTPAGSRPPGACRPGLATRGWADRWDTAARNAVEDLLATPAAAVATRLLVPLVGTLSPPKGVHGASWVREVAELLGAVAPEVLDELARGLRLTRKTDLPFAADLPALVRKAAAVVAGAGTPAGRPAGPLPSIDAWVAGLACADPADPTVALTRALLARLGLETTWSWLRDVAVDHDPGSGRLTLRLPGAFVARWVRDRLAPDIVIAARTLWPALSEADLVIVEGTHGT